MGDFKYISLFFILLLASCSANLEGTASNGFSSIAPIVVEGIEDGVAPIGEEVQLIWEITDEQSATVLIDVSFDQGQTFQVIETALINTGTYTYSTPRIPGAIVVVRVLNEDGETIYAQTADFRLEGEVDLFAPTPPEFVGFDSDTYSGETAFEIHWTASEDIGDSGLREEPYEVKLYSQPECQGEVIETFQNSDTHLLFQNLVHSTVYSASLSAIDWVGNISTPICSNSFEIDIHIPTLELESPGSQIGYTNSLAVNVEIGNDSSAAYWCITEDLTFRPYTLNDVCPGGVGVENGWLEGAPSEVTLSSGDGEKTLHTWIADSSGQVLNSRAGLKKMILDQTAPSGLVVDGVTGDGESIPDGYLGGTFPTVHLPEDTEVDFYDTSIVLDSDSSLICPSQTIASPIRLISFTDCGLVDGETYRAVVIARDFAGNQLSLPDYLFQVDATPPGAFSIVDVSGGLDSMIDTWFTTQSPVVEYTDSTGEFQYLIEVRNSDNNMVCSSQSAAQNITSYDFSAAPNGSCQPFVNGEEYFFFVTAKDQAALTEPASNSPFISRIDLNPPSIDLAASEGVITDQTHMDLTFVTSDAQSGIASVECQFGGGGFSDCISPQSFSGLSENNYSFDIRATDSVGLVSSESFSWVVDLNPPVLSLIVEPATVSNEINPEISFSATDISGVERYECELNSGGFSQCTSPKSYIVAQGSHQIKVRAFDQFSRFHEQESSFVVDTTDPTVTIDSAPGLFSSDEASFSFTGSDTGGGIVASTECQLDSDSWEACTSPKTYSGLPEGAHTFRVRSLDTAGNTGDFVSHDWTVDATAPVVTIDSSLVGTSSPSFTFSNSDSGGSGFDSYECKLSGTEDWTTCTSGKSYSGIGSGSYTFEVRGSDTVGNTGAVDSVTWSNGGWGAFGSWGSCSASCGGGTQSRSRVCNSPAPANGGMGCVGSDSQNQSCNTQACCSGYSYAGYCYYKGGWGQSCTTVCASRGGCNLAGTRYIGSSGTNGRCQTASSGVGGLPSNAVIDYSAGVALGCGVIDHPLAMQQVRARVGTPTTNCGSSVGIWRRVCACNN